VVARARVILDELEALDRKAPVQALVDDLPLFSAARPQAPPSAARCAARRALAALAPDELGPPREALEQLYRS
jgi:DNA mismatch repair protein MutS